MCVCVCIWGGKKRLEGERKITNRGDCDFEGLRELWRSSKNCFWDNCDVDQNILLLASSKTCRFSKNKTIKTLFSVKFEIEEKVNTIGWRPCSNRKPPSDVHLVGIDFIYFLKQAPKRWKNVYLNWKSFLFNGKYPSFNESTRAYHLEKQKLLNKKIKLIWTWMIFDTLSADYSICGISLQDISFTFQ